MSSADLIAESGVLLFNPADDIELVEDVLEFDETIERPEDIRFFTLQEQQQDYLEKLLPKVAKIPKKKLQDARHELDMMTRVYSDVLEETTDGFRLREPEQTTFLPWVHFYNDTNARQGEVARLFCNPLQRGVNYYPRLLTSLPKKAYRFESGEPVVASRAVRIDTPDETIIQLPTYTRTRTYFRDDGTYFIDTVKQEGTEDDPKFTAYRVDPPPLSPPNPITDHPFLSGHKEPKILNSTEPLSQLLPNLGTIMDHAVPQTQDPYGEGLKYLKVYDVRLSQVPWGLWKRKFPPAPLIQESPDVMEIAFKASSAVAPSQVLLDLYKTPWYPGMSPRHWLSLQVDGGVALSRILLSKASEHGVLAIPPPNPLPASAIPGTAAECVPATDSFETFAAQGVYRQVLKFVKLSKDNEGYIISGQCVPLAMLEQERQDALFANRLPWETIKVTVPATYIEPPPPKEEPKTALPDALPESRRFILSILEDDDRADLDKVDDIRLLLETATLNKAIYSEKDTNEFLVCEHTLTLLQKGMSDDFKRTWLVQTGGSMSCKFCGEAVIGEILVDQDEFDEQGHVNTHAEAFAVSTFHGTPTLTESLAALSSVFEKTPAEDLFYLILTLLQVMPERNQLMSVLGYVRQLHGMKSYKEKTESQRQNYSGVFGICGAITLLLTHEPALVPRRRFASKAIEIRGFPRDTASTEDAPLVNGLLFALRSTFESYPIAFKGPSATFVRTLLASPGDQRKLIFAVLSSAFLGSDVRPTPMTALYRKAATLTVADKGYELENAYTAPLYRPPTTPSQKPNYHCKEASPMWMTISTRAPLIQAPMVLSEPIAPNPHATPVSIPQRSTPLFTPTAAQVSKSKFTPKSKVLKEMVATDSPAALQTMVLQSFSILRQTSGLSDLTGFIVEHTSYVQSVGGDYFLVRDYLQGILRELFSRLDEVGEGVLKKDLTLRSIMTTMDDAKRTVMQLRASERELLKRRLKAMTDVERDITKQLLDRGLVPYLITREDRELFAGQLPVADDLEDLGDEERDAEEGIPRMDGPQGEVPVNQAGDELQTDYGDYGDHQARTGEGEEYQVPTWNDDYDGEQY